MLFGVVTAVRSLMMTQKSYSYIIARTKCNAHTAPLFTMLKLLNLYDIHKLQVASFMFKVNHYMLPVYFCNMFAVVCNFHMHNTRHRNDYHREFNRTSLMANTIRVAGPLLLNSIDPFIKSSVSLSVFKNAYRHHLLGTIV